MIGCDVCEDRQVALVTYGCTHPRALVVDQEREDGAFTETGWPQPLQRVCVACGYAYDRGGFLGELRARIRARHRLPPSPWTAAERSADPF